MSRVIFLYDILNKERILPEQADEEHRFKHGGYGSDSKLLRIWKALGYETEYFYQGMPINDDDIFLLTDRKNFYFAYKYLLKHGYIDRTVCELIESGVVDRKCGERIVKKIKDAFPAILTYHDDLIDDAGLFKIWPTIRTEPATPRHLTEFDKRKLACLVNSNYSFHAEPGEQYSLRKSIVEFMEASGRTGFHVYGRGWDGYAGQKGMVEDKYETYGSYKFVFCIENYRNNGYITEKLFDAFLTGNCVPVYGGAPNIDRYVPGECYIDLYAYSSLEELAEYMEHMSETEWRGYLKAIGDFVSSDEFQAFGAKANIENRIKAIRYVAQDRGRQSISPFGRLKVGYYVGLYEYLNKLIHEHKR